MGSFNTIFGLLGGLALFLFGMEMMSDGLQKAAGERMRYILGLLTKNPLLGVLAGALVTAVLQSSSATTVMVIGFVSAGLMTLPQAISIIMGANIGTTITAQIIAFNISDYIYPIVFVGFLIAFVSRKELVKNIGNTIFGFGLLFIGIEIMGDTMRPLANSQVFLNLIGKVADIPLLGLLLGTGITLLVQSSSAVIAVLQNFAAQAGPDGMHSILGLYGAIPILLGSNIGTTITALLASIGQSRNAKRTAIAHSVFNISGSILFMLILPYYTKLIQMIPIASTGKEVDIIARQIANAHTGFNIVTTLIWLPLIGLLVRIVMWILPEKENEKSEAHVQFLDVKVLNQPLVALNLVSKEICNYAERIRDYYNSVQKLMLEGGLDNLDTAKAKMQGTRQMHHEIYQYLIALFSNGSMNAEQTMHCTDMLYIMEDLERIGKGVEELFDSASQKTMLNYQFSKKAMEEIQESFDVIGVMMDESVQYVMHGDQQKEADVSRYMKRIAKLEKNVRKNHKKRVKEGDCRPEFTNLFANIFHSMEKIGENCSNMTEAASEETYLRYLPE